MVIIPLSWCLRLWTLKDRNQTCLTDWLLSSAQQGTIREKPETEAPAQLCHDSLWGPGQVAVFSGLSFPANSKTYLNKKASEVSSSSNALWEHRPKALDSCLFMTTWLIITQGWAQWDITIQLLWVARSRHCNQWTSLERIFSAMECVLV